ncbi:glycosyltransferase, partial [Chloroflexota bacterium]
LSLQRGQLLAPSPNPSLPDFNREIFLNRLGISPQKKVVLTLSRLVGWKGVDRVIRAAPEVIEKTNNVVFVIVGDGPERRNLELLAQQREVDSQVKFVGATPHDEVSGFMNSADIFVSLLDLANLPVPILEAMACGRCIVSFDDGALERIIENGKSGVLIKPELVDVELPKILLDLLNDDSRRQQLGREAREFALNNLETWEERIAKEIRLIEEIALRHKLRRRQDEWNS